MEVTKDMLIGEILKKDQTIAAILMASGMHCVGCQLHRVKVWKKLLWFMAWTVMSWLQK